jgi:alpha-beta hydrolase superfamily lysophospholipase
MYASEGIQTDCMPKQWNTDQPYKGTILLLHGFTACPQQYFETYQHLNDAGYNVLAPLLPGHGLDFNWVPVYENDGPWYAPWSRQKLVNWKGDDVVDRLASSNDEFAAYVDRLNAVMKEVPGERVVSGLSLGGAVAMLTGATTVSADDTPLYTRQLISVPLMDFGDAILSTVLGLASK